MNFYEVLGVADDADRAEIRAAYRRLSREYHPDVNDDPTASEQFSVLTRAEEVLTDPGERDAYDRLGHRDYVRNRYPGGLPDVEFDHVDGGQAGSGQAGTDGRSPSARPGGETATSGHRERARRTRRRRGRDTGRGPPTGSDSQGDASTGSDQGRGTAADSPGSATDATDGSERPHETARYPGAGGDAGPGTRWSAVGGFAVTVREHLTVSARWLAVVGAATVYGAGLPAYLRAGDEGVGRLLAALVAADPMRIVGAVSEAGYDLPGVVAFTRESGVRAGGVPTDAALLLAGAVLLPLATTAAVVGLRRRATWRPSRLYALGAFGPAAAALLQVAVTRGWAPMATLPLVAELALLIAVPVLSLVAFLVARLLLAAPVRQRDG